MPYDPVREAQAALDASPREAVSSLPPIQSKVSVNGSVSNSHYPHSDPSPSASHFSPHQSSTRDIRSYSERRGNSLAHILTSDDRPGPSPTDDPVPIRSSPVVPSSASSGHWDGQYQHTQSITLPPADHRPNFTHYRDRDPATYSPRSSRHSLSPVATRSSSPVRGRSPEDILSFPHRPRPSLSPLAVREAEEILYSFPNRPSASPISHRGTPLTLSPVQSFRSIDDRPPTSQQPVIAPLLPSPTLPPTSPTMQATEVITEVKKPSPIPYAPKNRKTPADSVLIPLSQAEMQTYQHSRNPLRANKMSPNSIPITLPPSDDKKRSKRRRDNIDEEVAPSKRSRDAGIVVDHYNQRPNVNIQQRQDSPIIGLKNFNNWIKSVLIAKWAVPALGEQSSSGDVNERRHNRPKGKILDLGCGKGGDLQKWHKSRAQLYCGIDVAETSIMQARDRATSLRSAGGFVANFFVLDCYSHPISDVLDKEMLASPFDVVTMQFCMHYAFESISKVRMMLENVARYLRKGGRFVGTIPNASFLQERLQEVPSDATELSFGNSVYKITFETRQTSLFGQRYSFFLLDAVEDVPEYVVHWDNFLQLAQEHDLHLLEKKEFHDIFQEEQDHKDYGPLLKRMRVVDDQGDSQMDEDQWEAANVYMGFVFEKR